VAHVLITPVSPSSLDAQTSGVGVGAGVNVAGWLWLDGASWRPVTLVTNKDTLPKTTTKPASQNRALGRFDSPDMPTDNFLDATIAPVSAKDDAMTMQANKDLVLRFYEELWNRGNLAAAEELVAQDYVRHDLRPGAAPPGPAGQQAIAQRAAPPFRTFGWKSRQSFEGDLVVARWTISGTHSGPWAEVSATDRAVHWAASPSRQLTVEERAPSPLTPLARKSARDDRERPMTRADCVRHRDRR
jgi:hypothetical protein